MSNFSDRWHCKGSSRPIFKFSTLFVHFSHWQDLLLRAVAAPSAAAAAEYVHQHLPRFVAAELAAGDETDLKFAEKALARAFCRLVRSSYPPKSCLLLLGLLLQLPCRLVIPFLSLQDEAIGASVEAAYSLGIKRSVKASPQRAAPAVAVAVFIAAVR